MKYVPLSNALLPSLHVTYPHKNVKQKSLLKYSRINRQVSWHGLVSLSVLVKQINAQVKYEMKTLLHGPYVSVNEHARETDESINVLI